MKKVEYFKLPSPSLLLRLSSYGPLDASEQGLVLAACANASVHSARTEIISGYSTFPPRVLLSGWACEQRLLHDGRRQIVSFFVPGDLMGSIMTPRMQEPASVVALTETRSSDAELLMNVIDSGGSKHSRLVRALLAMVDEASWYLRQHIVRLGRQTAYERVANLLLELAGRLKTVGLSENGNFSLPLTQEVLADALGLSIVHVNRTLQKLRGDGLIATQGSKVTLLQIERMTRESDWSPLSKLHERSGT